MANEVQILLSPLKGGASSCSKSWKNESSKKTRNWSHGATYQKTGLEKTSAIASVAKLQTLDALNDALEKLSHKFPATVHMAHQKPRPALEKVTPLKRIYIIQQPRKC